MLDEKYAKLELKMNELIEKNRISISKQEHRNCNQSINQQQSKRYKIYQLSHAMTFRSREMGHYQLIIPRQNAYNVINQLAMYDIAHIVDNGDLINRQFYPQIKRCEELLIRIDSVLERLKREGIEFEEYDEQEKMFIEKLYFLWTEEAKKLGIMPIKMLDKVENDINREFKRFRDIDQRLQKIKGSKKQLLQKIACYQTIDSFFGQSYIKRQSQEYYLNNIASGSEEMSGVSYMVGVIDSKNLLRMNRMVYRVSRGYACIKQMTTFEFEPLKAMQEKIVLIIYPTSRTSTLEKKIQRVVETFCHNFFLFNKMENNIRQTLQQLRKEYNQVIDFISMNQKQMTNFLHQIKNIRYLESWRIFLWKERLIYETLNKFESREQIIYGELYVPKDKVELLGKSFGKMTPSPTIHELDLGRPPTAFDTNCYTFVAQEITNTYGVPRYQEFNPSILTTVTFPFFFGVMFGDIAHGAALLTFGIFLVFWNDTIKRSSLKMFSDLRHIILMMGFFAFYCGWVYNDFMGMNMNIFGSCYKIEPMPEQGHGVEQEFRPIDPQCIYPFGVDPVWGRAKQNLQFVNSLKMKVSVIIAIIHMTVGVIIKAFNSLYFKKKLDFFFEFIPQFIFLFLLFGYMDFLIVYKWLTDWNGNKNPPPSIISTMMNIGLKLGKTATQVSDGATNMWGERGNTSQDSIQLFILLISVICVPLMLLPKPLIEIRKLKQKKQKKNPLAEEENQSQMELERELNPLNPSHISKGTKSHSDDEHGDIEPNEIFVHQLIETIEYVLGAISNTASYLRLWALSLAHSQLALVFFQKTLENGYTMEANVVSPVVMSIGFYFLIWVTFGILMCMDTMECFLHSLRLHWVEFQNKFYKGDGYKYVPLSYRNSILEKKMASGA